MAVNDVVKVTLSGRLHGQRHESGIHIRYQTPEADPTSLAADFTTNIVPLFQAATTGQCTYEVVSVDPRLPAEEEGYDDALPVDTDGALLGDAIPGQVAAVLSLRTGLKGRRRRGRFYVSGAPEASSSLGRWADAQQTLFTNIGDGLIARYGPTGLSADYRLVTFSPEDLSFVKKSGEPAPRVGNVVTTVRSIVVNPYTRTQRRRAIGVGE